MTSNDNRFSGGDGLTSGTLEHATHLVMMSNELNGGRGAYRISNAVLGASGPSYGPFQYDLGGNSRARELFEEISTTAVDANGRRFITDQDLDTIRGSLYQPFSRIRANPAAQAAYDRLLPSMNSALESGTGRRLINDDYLVGINAKIESLNAVISSIPDLGNRAFLKQNRLAQLIVLDTANQYGPPVNHGLRQFMGMNDQSDQMWMPGRRYAEQIGVNRVFGVEDMVRYKLETQYGQTNAGARDILRRISNIVDAVGIYDVDLSQEDHEFLRTGLRQYLIDNGRDSNFLDDLAVRSLRNLGQITDAERTVAQVKKTLNALGITDASGQSLVVDGNLGGPNSRTHQAIAAFKQQHGLTEPMSNAELLMATQVALRIKQSLDFDRPVLDGLPGPVRTPHLVNGLPDYLRVNNTQARMPTHEQAQTLAQVPEQKRTQTYGHQQTDAPATDPVQVRMAELQDEIDALRRQMQNDSPSPHSRPAPRHEADLHVDAHSPAIDVLSRSRPEREPEAEPESQQPYPQRDAQTFPTGHRDYALFEAIRQQLPDEYSDEMVAHATLEAKKGGITRPDQIKGMAIENGQLTVMGKSGMDFAFVELTASAPPLPETMQQSAAFDRQQAIQLAQFQEQQQQLNMSRGGFSMTL